MTIFYKTFQEFCNKKKELDKKPLKKFLVKFLAYTIYTGLISWLVIFFIALAIIILGSTIGLLLLPILKFTFLQYLQLIGGALVFTILSSILYIILYIYLDYAAQSVSGKDFKSYSKTLKEWGERCKSYQKTEEEIDQLLKIENNS